MTTARVWHCPRCGAPIETSKGALIKCSFCGSEVDLRADALPRQYPMPPPRIDASPQSAGQAAANVRLSPSPPSPIWGRLKIASGPLLGFAAGYAAVEALLAFLRNGSPEPIPIAMLMGVVTIGGAMTGRTIAAAILAEWAGACLVAKPFLRPVWMKSGHVFSETSDTHLEYLVPGAMLIVFASILLMSIRRGEKRPREARLLRALNAIGLAAGLAVAAPHLAEETTAEAIERYRPRFAAVRETWKQLHAKLPPPDQPMVEKRNPNLTPRPVLNKRLKIKTNTEVVAAEQLLDPEAKVSYELYASGWLRTALAWTGPNNPMSETILYKGAGDFTDTLEDALACRYVVVYRPGGKGFEIFVFDVSTTDIVTSFTMERGPGVTENGVPVALELARATGGLFEFD